MKTIELDFKNISTLDEMHIMLNEKFGFPDFYGKNVNALIDCLSDLRYPEYEMCKFHLDSKEDILIIKLKNFTDRNDFIINHFLTAIKGVNNKNLYSDTLPSIHLILI
jgi:Barstar (barnase inhibitor).